MVLFAFAQSLSHAASAFLLDDSTVSVLAMLVGLVGAWTISGFFQPKAKKVPIDRKDDTPRR